MKKTIKEKALLVNWKQSAWSATKSDNDASKELDALMQAKSGSSKITKSLIDRKALSEIQSIYNTVKKFHETNTMPWYDNGYRILPATKYMNYTERMREFKIEFEAAVETILDNYSDYIKQAQKDLGKMFKLHEYPTISEIERSFRFTTTFMPVPDVTDFRVDLNDSEIATLQAEMQLQIRAAEKASTEDLFKRLHTAIEKIVERLSEPENSFKDSLFNNLEDLTNLLPEMNVTDNKELTDTIKAAKALLKNPDSVRHDDKLREQTAERAKEILDTIEGYADCF